MEKIFFAFFAALFGGFFGAVVKEYLSNSFSNSKRKRELRSKIIQNIVVLFELSKLHINFFNATEVNLFKSKLLWELRKNSSISSELKMIIDKDIEGITELTNDYQDKDLEIFSKISQLKGEIISDSIECENHFKEKQMKIIREAIKQIVHSLDMEKLTIKSYYNITDLNKLSEFMDNVYPKELDAIFRRIETDLDNGIHSIHQALYKNKKVTK
jgi:hypothetical protein